MANFFKRLVVTATLGFVSASPMFTYGSEILVTIPSDSSTVTKDPWIKLLDKNLSQWGTYLSFAHEKTYKGQKPLNEKGEELTPVGYNKNEKNVFTVLEEQGEPVLKISGEIYGCAFTKNEYSNYHLKLKVKFGNKKYGPRIGKLNDSGILYHSVGESGVDYWRSWMLSQEFQIMEGHTGDYWNIANSAIDIRAYLSEGKMNNIANIKQPFLPFGTGSQDGFCLRSENHESPDGEWTSVELLCFEGKSLHIVNGQVVMVLQNSRYVENGQPKPLVKGKIQLQSEGSEVYFKDILIKNIDEFPQQYKAYFD
ncbi:3-keto-disaccharide hydrolase [Rubrolithibacter danxiaensis]|uniref:3-keto-disaccharide hydrolase n=1 Tax=Rubrolithibacter danxiaensis TaxID=3390805 RepID=UPI003BF82021